MSLHQSILGAALLLPAALSAHLQPSQIWPADMPRFAPGQIVSVDFFDIAQEYSQGVKADSMPLPTVLAGLMVLLQQHPVGQEVAVPLISINQDRCGADARPGCIFVTHVKLQIPFTLFIPPPGSLAPVSPALLTPVVGGVRRSPVRFMPAADNIHIQFADACEDSSLGTGMSCRRAVRHADGRIVSVEAPALSGETVTIDALGLGRTTPRVAAGVATPATPRAVTDRLSVVYEFAANAPPRSASTKPPEDSSPVVAALAPGNVGVYQLKVAIPPVPSSVPACGGSVVSNLTITILGRTSAAGAAVCVVPGPARGADASDDLHGRVPNHGVRTPKEPLCRL